jgi:VWFA-related protein
VLAANGQRMKRTDAIRLLGVILGALLAGKALAQAPEGPLAPQPGVPVQQPPAGATIKLQTVLVNTPVTVRDATGQMVHNLEKADFHVTDNGIEQQISHFDLGSEPLSLLVLVETSSHVEAILPEIRRTGTLLTQTVMGPSGEAAIVGFNDSIDKLLDFTNNTDAVENTISRLREGTSGVRLYDAMATGVEMLSKRPAATPSEPGRRRVLLVVSESDDKESEAKLGEVLRNAQLANVTIYSVGISSTRAALQKKPESKRPLSATPEGTFGQPPTPGSVQTPTTEAQRAGNIDLMALAVWAVTHIKDQVTDSGLAVAATATGGAHMATWKDRSIETAIDEIGGELHSQYMLTYTPTGSDAAGYHEIKVDVDRKDLKVRARPGYYLSGPTG